MRKIKKNPPKVDCFEFKKISFFTEQMNSVEINPETPSQSGRKRGITEMEMEMEHGHKQYCKHQQRADDR